MTIEPTVELPLSLIITVVTVLAGAVVTLAATMWNFVHASIKRQDAVIENQSDIIDQNHRAIVRLSQGCGEEKCSWRAKIILPADQ